MSEFEQNIKLDNFKAHYQSILGNIKIANSELEQTREDEKKAKESLVVLTERENTLRKEVGDLVEQKERVVQEADGKLALLAAKEKTLEQLELDTLSFVESENSRLESERVSLDKQIQERADELSELTEQKEVLEKSVSVLGEYVTSLTSQVETLSTNLASLRRDFSMLEQEFKEMEEAHARRVRDMDAEIASLIQYRKEEADKIVEADVYIKDKEKDIAIITRRLQALFNEVTPGVALKI